MAKHVRAIRRRSRGAVQSSSTRECFKMPGRAAENNKAKQNDVDKSTSAHTCKICPLLSLSLSLQTYTKQQQQQQQQPKKPFFSFFPECTAHVIPQSSASHCDSRDDGKPTFCATHTHATALPLLLPKEASSARQARHQCTLRPLLGRQREAMHHHHDHHHHHCPHLCCSTSLFPPAAACLRHNATSPCEKAAAPFLS